MSVVRTALTATEAAESMGCSDDLIYDWVNAGVLGRVPHTAKVLIPVDELRRFANSTSEVAA